MDAVEKRCQDGIDPFFIRPATKSDIPRITEIYNTNPQFLAAHLGHPSIKADFILHEMEEMTSIQFLSCVILNAQSGNIIGVIDYQPDDTVYLSLLMIDASFQGNGVGTAVYHLFEQEMAASGKHFIRIDVVNDYEGNVTGFWKNLGFLPKREVQLHWGQKQSTALVMVKSI